MTHPIWPADQNYLNSIFGAGAPTPAEFMAGTILYDAQASGNPRFRRAPGIGVYPPSPDELGRQLADVERSRPHRGPPFAEAGAPQLEVMTGRQLAPQAPMVAAPQLGGLAAGTRTWPGGGGPEAPTGSCACESPWTTAFASKQDTAEYDSTKALKAAGGIALGTLVGALIGSQSKGGAKVGAAIGAAAAVAGTVGGYMATTAVRGSDK